MRTARGHQYVLVMTDHFMKLVRTVRLRSVTAAGVEMQFVFPYCPPLDLITGNSRQFKSRFFRYVRKILNLHNSFTKTYHPLAIGQVGHFNLTILSTLRTFVTYHLRDWDLCPSALKYAYNFKPQNSTSPLRLELVLSNHPEHLFMQNQPYTRTEPTKFKQKWKLWLEKTLI